MRIDVVTIFPPFFSGPLEESLIKKARDKGLVSIQLQDLRDYTEDNHRSVDDKPFGGGPGMVMMPEPIFRCVENLKTAQSWVISVDARGEPMSQKIAHDLAQKKHLILIAGHYEGVDHRVHEHLADQVVSVGDFITMGGEAPSLCLIEAVARLIPGVLGNENSVKHESFEAGQLEYPQYTRPRDFRGLKVPEVLVSGNHPAVARWREKAAHEITKKKRPDLL